MTSERTVGARNPAVVEAARLHRARERRASGLTLIEGPHLLAEAVGAGFPLERVFALEDDAGTQQLAVATGFPLVPVTEAAMGRIAGTSTPRGPVAVLRIPTAPVCGDDDMLVAWGVSDPGNVGMLIRIAAGFGWCFGFSPGTADPWSPKTLRSGSGGHFKTGIRAIEGLVSLQGRVLLASAPRGGSRPERPTTQRPVALLIGEEGPGLPPDIVAGCDQVLTIDMPGGTESLNAAVAAGILVYELTRADR